MQPIDRCLDEALCLEYQVQNASATLFDRDDLTDSARKLLGHIRGMATHHIVDLDPHVAARRSEERVGIAREIAQAEELLGTTLPAPLSFHLRELYGLVDQAALAYEALVFTSRAASRLELGARAVRHLEDCIHAMGELDIEIPTSLLNEVERAGGRLSEPEFDECVQRIASAWERDGRA